MSRNDIKDFSKEQLISWFQEHEIRSFRADQVFKWAYIRNADTFAEMTDLSKKDRELLEKHFSIKRLNIKKKQISSDGSIKYLFQLEDGNFIESVLMPEKNHYTLCISTQVGCGQGCAFCMTARGGFKRNLTASEILAQIRDIKKTMDDPLRLTNIVVMGMGEPLANYRNLISALGIITDTDVGFKFSTRRVTLSTAGLINRFPDLSRDTKISLAVSLNAVDNDTRSMLMPVNKKFPIEALIDACANYPLPHRRKITFEYILIKGVNDSPDQARKLAKLLRPVKAKINIIPFNEHEGSDFKRPEESAIRAFEDVLHSSGYTTIIRYSKGTDISAACGQLGAETAE